MVKPSQVDTNGTTPEQISRAHKCYDCQTGKNFYMVENESGKLDDNGNLVEYKVTYSSDKGFQCSCDSGQYGFYNTKRGYCKHIAWSMAASKEDAKVSMTPLVATRIDSNGKIAGLKVVAELPTVLFINGVPATEEEHARIMNAQPKRSTAKAPNPKPFSLLR